ncbi:MAG: hypothetical protein J6P61_03495 [Erysipelotrichaceae bacterium]|nr:hypothetical protein [Erysipelotrichaceae bacterium]
MTKIIPHYYYYQLPESDRAVYDVLFEAFKRFEKKVDIGKMPHKNSIFRICEYISFDHPDLFWIDYYHVMPNITSERTIVEMPYYFEDEEIIPYLKRARAWRSTIVSGVDPKLPTAEKLRLIFDYFERRTTYGRESYKFSQTIIGPCRIDNEVSVCEGIAKSLKYLCDALDIPCIVLVGDVYFSSEKGLHAWNIVEIDGVCRHLDGVRFLTTSKMYGRLLGKYLMTDEEAKVITYGGNHKYNWNEDIIPKCV